MDEGPGIHAAFPKSPPIDEVDAFTGDTFIIITNIFHFWEGIIGSGLAILFQPYRPRQASVLYVNTPVPDL